MKYLILILLLLTLGCATVPRSVPGTCVPEAIYSAWVWEARTGMPSRIALTLHSPGMGHAQAQGWDGKQWVYLTTDHSETRVDRSHYGHEPYRYVSLDEWIREQAQQRKP